MEKKYLKTLSALTVICLLITCSGCNFTTTTVTSEIRSTVTYVDGDGSVVSAPESQDSESSGGQNTSGIISNIQDNTVNNAGEIDASKEEKLSGSFELQIFVGGYGSEAWEYAIAKFEELNPELEVNAHLDTNVNAQMKTRWAKDNPPDFVFIEGTNMPAEVWMEEGKLLDLSDLYENGKVYGTDTLIKDQLKNGLVSYYKNTDKIYQMPVLLSTYGMWYDEAFLNSKGWSVPKNYTQLKSFCAASKKAGVTPLIYPGNYSGYLVWGLLMPAVASEAVASNDLDFFYDVANAANESVFADKRFRRCLEKISELAKAGYFDQNALSMNHITSQASWLAHNAVLIPNGLWLENEMKNSIPDGFRMRYYPAMLQDEGDPACIIASSAMVGVAAKGKNTEAAKAFISFLYTDDVARKFAELCAVPSATRVDVSGAELTEAAKQVNEMINSSDVRLVAKGSTTWGSVDATINEVVNSIVSQNPDKNISVDEAIDKLQKATKKKNG